METAIEYRREMNRNYMVVHSEWEWNDTYTVRMLSGNKIPCLLNFQEKVVDGRVMFYYDITSKQPLSRLLGHRKLAAWELQTLISDLILVLRQMERYLLDERKLCLKPEYIYLEPESYHGSFCLIPGYGTDFTIDFLELAQYFLDHVDHSDGDAVILAFAIFQECRKENFGVEDIEQCLIKKDGPEAVTEKVVEDKIEVEYPEDFTEKDEFSEENSFKVKQTLAASILIICGLVALPVIIVLLFGFGRLIQWKWMILAAEMILSSGLIIMLRDKNAHDLETQPNEAKQIFEESFPIDELWIKEESEELTKNIEPATIADEDDMQTVLLTSQARERIKKTLVSITDREEISINYFPFIIGKNKSMADYCLNKPEVSRLHVKLEMVNAEYYITDLNSTNGTKINGESLNANETKKLHVGDELDIAGHLFRFQ